MLNHSLDVPPLGAKELKLKRVRSTKTGLFYENTI